jgi:hypothetical protein
MDNALVRAKVEMLERHVKIAKEGQEIALEYLRNAELTPAAAVRLLMDMMNVEKGSMGIPEAIEKVVGMSDEDLVQELYKAFEEAPLERLEAENE